MSLYCKLVQVQYRECENGLSPLKLLLRELSTLLSWAWILWSSAVKRTVLINVILNSIRFHGKDLMQERKHSKRTAR